VKPLDGENTPQKHDFLPFKLAFPPLTGNTIPAPDNLSILNPP
jgi:hypothetical protein